MPTYEYRCGACQREFEYRQRMNDPDLVTCEACGADKLERLISWTSVRSNTWQRALYKDNPKEAMKGTHACDLSKGPQRFTGNAPEPTGSAETSAAEPAATDDNSSDA